MIALAIAERGSQSVKAVALSIVTTVTQCGGDVRVLMADTGCGTATQTAAQITGATKVLVVNVPRFADGLTEDVIEQALAAAGDYNHILAPVTAYGKNIPPHVTTKPDVAQLFDIIKVGGPDTLERPIYADNATVIMQSANKTKVITVRGTTFGPAAATGGVTITESLTVVADAGVSQFVSREVMRSDCSELAAVEIIVSGGRGVRLGENYTRVLTPLADKLGVVLNASRTAVDAGFVPNDYQVGQTDKTVTPQLYIAVDIPGVIRHLAGMKDSRVIVTISEDPEVPIFQVVDYGLVSDLDTVMPELVTALN